MIRLTSKLSQQMLQDFGSVSDHDGTLSIKRLILGSLKNIQVAI